MQTYTQVYLQTVIPLILSLVCSYIEINLRYKQMESGEQMGIFFKLLLVDRCNVDPITHVN